MTSESLPPLLPRVRARLILPCAPACPVPPPALRPTCCVCPATLAPHTLPHAALPPPPAGPT